MDKINTGLRTLKNIVIIFCNFIYKGWTSDEPNEFRHWCIITSLVLTSIIGIYFTPNSTDVIRNIYLIQAARFVIVLYAYVGFVFVVMPISKLIYKYLKTQYIECMAGNDVKASWMTEKPKPKDNDRLT